MQNLMPALVASLFYVLDLVRTLDTMVLPLSYILWNEFTQSQWEGLCSHLSMQEATEHWSQSGGLYLTLSPSRLNIAKSTVKLILHKTRDSSSYARIVLRPSYTNGTSTFITTTKAWAKSRSSCSRMPWLRPRCSIFMEANTTHENSTSWSVQVPWFLCIWSFSIRIGGLSCPMPFLYSKWPAVSLWDFRVYSTLRL